MVSSATRSRPISLSAAAEAVGDHETKRVSDEIIREEEALANRLKPILPVVMAEYLRREETGQAAKRYLCWS